MNMLEDFKERVIRLENKGVEIVEFFVHPLSVPSLVKAIQDGGMDPFPYSHFSWTHPFRKRDKNLYLFGYRVIIYMDCPIGAVGISSTNPLPEGDLDSPEKVSDVNSQLAKSSSGTPTDVLVMAMEGIERYKNVVVLRFHGDGSFDSFSTYNQLELQSILQKAVVSMMNGGL